MDFYCASPQHVLPKAILSLHIMDFPKLCELCVCLLCDLLFQLNFLVASVEGRQSFFTVGWKKKWNNGIPGFF